MQAADPGEALWVAAATPAIDLLVTEFEMPEGNGLELAQWFRAVHPKAPVLMVSGSLQEVESAADDLDEFAFLAKPFSWDELVDKVYTLLTSQRRASSTAASSSPNLSAGMRLF